MTRIHDLLQLPSRAAAGVQGSALELQRKVRLIAHRILLERVLGAGWLAQAMLDAGGADA